MAESGIPSPCPEYRTYNLQQRQDPCCGWRCAHSHSAVPLPGIQSIRCNFMNWLVIAVVGAAAAWFEYNYQRSRHPKKPKPNSPSSPESPGTEAAHVEKAGEVPSISPGSENDKKL